MKFPTINKADKVELTKGDLINLTALLSAGSHAILETAIDMKERGETKGFIAGVTLARGSHNYMVTLFGLLGVAPEDVEEFSKHLQKSERAEYEAMKEAATATKQ